MQSRILALVAAGGLAFPVSFAHAGQGWYISGQVGGSLLDPAEFDDPTGTLVDPDTEFDFGPGFSASGAIGYAFINNVRVEGEFTYAKHDIDFTIPCVIFCFDLFGSGRVRKGIEGGGDVTAMGFMANAFYDIPTAGRWTPYFGGGVGIAHLSVDGVQIRGVPLADDEDDTVFAYQLGGGIGYEITPSTALTLDYRYFATADPEFNAVTGAPFSFEYGRHDLRVGIRYVF